MEDEFTRFEREGWQRVADKYDSVWSASTRQFIFYLLDATEVSSGMSTAMRRIPKLAFRNATHFP
jgi:hypothetical protein